MILLIYTIFSFVLDNLISTYINYSLPNISYLSTIYALISLIIIEPFYINKKKYYITLIIIGILFDIVYTNTFIINIILFLVVILFSKLIDYKYHDNLLTINIKTILGIIIYHTLTYFIMLITHYNNYDIILLWNIILRSIIMTIIYTSISYIILKKINPKKIK